MHRLGIALTAVFTMTSVNALDASPPTILSDTPLIHLADNLDEKDRLGWCIDTRGRGYAEDLQAHSCKPARRGNDTQFFFEAPSGLIRSVPYEGECMAWVRPGDPALPFGLRECDQDDASQLFSYDDASKEIRIGDSDDCVVVGAGSASAGPYMSRLLLAKACDSVDPTLKQWVLLD